MTTQRLGAILASGALAQLCDASRRVQELQQVFFESTPPPLARACRVKALRAGMLYLSAENAAVATKLRQLAPRLLTAIRDRVPEVNGIRVGVQVSSAAPELQRDAKKTSLRPEIIEKFEKLAATVPDSSLKAALHALARHQRG